MRIKSIVVTASKSSEKVERDPLSRPGRWLTLARAGWVLLTAALTAMLLLGLLPRFRELSDLCTSDPCRALALSAADAQALAELGITVPAYAAFHGLAEVLAGLTVGTLALLLFLRRGQDRMGLLAAYALSLFGLSFMVEADSALLRLNPTFLPAIVLLNNFGSLPFLLLFFLFPDGQFVPSWTRLPALLLVVAAVADTLIFAATSSQSTPFLLFVVPSALILGTGAQIYRYRRVSSAIEKQQTKWVVLGLMSTAAIILFWIPFIEFRLLPDGLPQAGFFLFGFGGLLILYMMLPFGVFFSIMRYRLWDVDLIIRRTLLYGLLTGLLVLVYFGSVVALQTIVQGLTGVGGTSPLIIVVSTLLIAALFNPLRRRLQNGIDRRFFRQKYDAQRVLAGFAATARDEVELAALADELVAVVQDTVQPEHITLWLRRDAGD